MSADVGYGICGHRNSFGTKVLCGNWVEDSFAANETKVRALAQPPVSEARHHYRNPAEREAPPDVPCGTKVSMKGLEQNLLLAHCQKGNVHNIPVDQSKYQTTYNRTFQNVKVPTKLVEKPNSRARERQMQAERAKLQGHFKTSYQQSSTAPYIPQAGAKVGKPDAKRRAANMAFTKGFIEAKMFAKLKSMPASTSSHKK